MELQTTLRMVGGEGETSYAKNSASQKAMATTAKSFAKIAITDMFSKSFPECLKIADLGCSSGPNSLMPTLDVIDAVHEICQKLENHSPEIQVFLNDLPGNDFNSIFISIPSLYEKLKKEKGETFGPCFIAGVPGSFHGRLFPSQTLNFVTSSTALQWLSQVPQGIEDNKENIYVGKTTPPHVIKAYVNQFHRDFSLFLSSRGEEVVPGGRMVISMLGRRSVECYGEQCYTLEYLAKSLGDMVSKGLVNEGKLNSFNLPIYFANDVELKKIITTNGSFDLDFMETFQINWDPSNSYGNKEYAFDEVIAGKNVANTLRAVMEPVIVETFGQEIIHELFAKYAEYVGEHLAREESKLHYHLLCLKRN